MSKQRKMILIAAAVGVICMFLPWVSISIPILGQTASQNGMHEGGIIVFLCLLATGVIAFMGDQSTNLNKTNWMAIIIVGGLAAIIMVLKFFNSMSNLSYVSFGFYGVLAASIAVVAFAFTNRSASDSLQSGFDSLKGDINRRMNSPTNTTNVTSTTPVSHTPSDDPARPTV